ncbi:MAG: acetyltransferase [Acidobacteriota bacterium]|nr:MAG: acetyltransferase [Acidobacteriota bacterium]
MSVLYLCGAGNSEGVRLALRVNEQQRRWDRIVVLDDNAARHGEVMLGVPIAGPFAMLAEARPDKDEIANLVARTTARRWMAREKMAAYGIPFATLVDPTVDARGAELARDVIIYQNATIGPEVEIADGSVVFMGAVVGHEAKLSRGCVLAPGAVINARVELGEGVYIGTNAALLPEVKVGDWATVGACTMVVMHVPADTTIMGVPGKILKLRSSRPKSSSTAKEAGSGVR